VPGLVRGEGSPVGPLGIPGLAALAFSVWVFGANTAPAAAKPAGVRYADEGHSSFAFVAAAGSVEHRVLCSCASTNRDYRALRVVRAMSERSKASSTVLVVDDNEANRLLAQGALEDEGYRVVLATGGAAAVEAFKKESPDCALLDVRMPEVDGFSACSQIRALPGGDETPIIFLTALRDVDTFDEALRVGADDFLTKPVRPAELIARVGAALKLRQMRVELREHYELLKHQRDALLRLQLQKERLSAFLVHDLKNPVNSMDLHAQLMLRDPSLSEKARGSATQIRHEARQLNRMIMNLLDVSKADEGKLVAKIAEVDIASMIAEVTSELAAAADARKVSIERTNNAQAVRADADLFRRVLANLIENAIRHAPTGTTIRVTSASSLDGIELSVADSGPGVPADQRDKVFDPFVQVDGGDRPPTRGGRGLGLAFCKRAVEAHGGSIWIEDGAPGAVFKFRIPA
jgi:two-component system, sensor histidine kinase and response regulator